MLEKPWRITLFGHLKAQLNTQPLLRFQTQKTGELLAYLAYFQDRVPWRDEVMEALWPEVDPVSGRNRLKQALSSLRRQMEPPGVPMGTVLVASRVTIALNLLAIRTDVAEFKSALHLASRATELTPKIAYLKQAVNLFQGELLASYYQNWILLERQQLQEAYCGALRELVILLDKTGEFEEAISTAERWVKADIMQEEAHQHLIRLYAITGRGTTALHQYETLERTLHEQLNTTPSAATQSLLLLLSNTSAEIPEGMLSAQGIQESGNIRPTRGSSAQKNKPERETPQARSDVSSLPVPFRRFVGRSEDVHRLLEMLCPAILHNDTTPLKDVLFTPKTRLVTLTGPGGSGKTRLAIEVATQLQSFFRDAIWFVPLMEQSDAQRLPDFILEALRLPEPAAAPPLDRIVNLLSRQPSLLILDGFEHFLDGSECLKELMERTQTLTCIVTSRQWLDLEGEQVFPVSPLSTPTELAALEDLLQYDSIRLFLDQAQAVRPDFQLTQRNAADVVAICQKLEGIPLAIELAASHIQILGLSRILAQLSQPFTFLVSQKKGRAPRHQTLRATIDGSYDRLPTRLQRFFAHLAIIRGGWNLESAAVVCEEAEALHLLSQLLSRSLITLEDSGGEARYCMLETLRQYAFEKTTERERSTLAQRHADYYLHLAEQAKAGLTSPDREVWLQRLEAEWENLETAYAWYRVWPRALSM